MFTLTRWRQFTALILLAAATSPLAGLAADDGTATTKAESDEVFGPTRVWKIHLRVTAENWKSMQPAGGGFPGFGPPPPGGQPGGPPGATPTGPPLAPSNTPAASPPQPNRGNAPGPGFRPGSFGFDFEYVKADIELDSQAFKDIGLRFKGNGTYMMSSSTRKRPFKLDFNRFVNDQRFHGLQQLNLHSNVMDPTHLRQALSYPVFAAAGVASPRTAFAEVTLTIEGEVEREYLGLYTLVEEIDKAFLRRHFQTDKGLLLKPEGTQGLEYKGEDWADYAWFEAKTKPKKSESRRVIETVRLIHKADDETFRREIGDHLDLDEIAGFLAANVLLSNMDSFLTHVHNYYVYLSPTTNKLVLLPWDLDLSMGAFFMAGSAEQLQELSITHPHVGQSRLIERLLEWDDFNKTYRNRLRTLNENCFGSEGLTTRSLPVLQAALKDLVALDEKRAAETQAARGPGGFGPGGFGPGRGPNMFGSMATLEAFLVKRRESVTAQLAGTSKGKTPGMGFGPGGPGGGGPGRGGPGGGGFGPGNGIGPQLLAAADTDRNQKLSREEFLNLADKWLREWDKDKSNSLNDEEIKTGLNEFLAPPANAAPGGFKPPAGFGPGMFLGPPLLKAADADKSGQVSKEEWTKHFGSWFMQWNTTADDTLDTAELVAGLNKVLAPPPGFGGPPGAGPSPPR